MYEVTRFNHPVMVPDGTVVETHRHRFEQIVINLVANSRDSLIRKTEQGPAGPLDIRLHAKGEGTLVNVDVIDTGIGVDPALRDRIFEPFVTNKQDRGGSGLGLFICRELLKQMGGDLELHQSSAAGTTFRLRIDRGGSAA